MLKLIEGLPPDMLSIEATGKVTHEDYRNVLIPAAETKMVQGPIKMLYVAGPDFTGYELGAQRDDLAFGFKHWHQFKRTAVETENAWLRAAIAMFCPLFPSQIQLFKLAELNAAKTRITCKERAGA
jgi:SpoIIAA-like